MQVVSNISGAWQAAAHWVVNSEYRQVRRALLKADKSKPINLALVYEALQFARKTDLERGIKSGDPLFASSVDITAALARYPYADETTILAAIIYPSLRSDKNLASYPRHFEDARRIFGNNVADTIGNVLQVMDIELPERTGESLLRTPQTEEERLKAFLYLAQESTENPRAALIRITEWLARMQNLPKNISKEQREHYAFLTDKLYAPLAAAYNFRLLQTDLEEQWLRLTDPRTHAVIRRQIDIASSAIERKPVRSWKRGEHKIRIRDQLQAEIDAAIPEELRGKYELRFRVKSAASIYKKKQEQKGKALDLSDIIGIRVIVKAEDEAAASYVAHKALTTRFKTVKGRHKDYIAEPKENGYQALHDVFAFKRGVFEVQCLGENMHRNNEDGPASHDAYKGNGPTLPKTVSVYIKSGDAFTLPYRATAADLAASLDTGDPDFAFTVSSAIIERNPQFALSHPLMPGNLLERQLMTGDRVEFIRDLRNVLDPKHRQHVIDACRLPDMRQKLQQRHQALMMGGQSIRPTERPPGGQPSGDEARP